MLKLLNEKYDITEICGADVLYSADGIINESENNLECFISFYVLFVLALVYANIVYINDNFIKFNQKILCCRGFVCLNFELVVLFRIFVV